MYVQVFVLWNNKTVMFEFIYSGNITAVRMEAFLKMLIRSFGNVDEFIWSILQYFWEVQNTKKNSPLPVKMYQSN